VIDRPKVCRLLQRCFPSSLEWDKHEATGQKYYDLCASVRVCECFVSALQYGTYDGGVTFYVHNRSLHALRIGNLLLFHYMCLHRTRYYTVPHIPYPHTNTHTLSAAFDLSTCVCVCVCVRRVARTHAKSAAASHGIILYM